MPVQWFIKKNDSWMGPRSTSALKALAESGDLLPDDLVRDGLEGKPVPARSVLGLFGTKSTSNVSSGGPPKMPPLPMDTNRSHSEFPQGMPPLPNSPAPTIPPPVVNSPQGSDESPEVWNPKVAIAWSFPLSFGFGALILARNWRSLGQPGREDRCMYWFYGSVIHWAAMPFDESMGLGAIGIWLFSLLLGSTALYFYEAVPQIEFLQNQYRPKSWLVPFGILFATVGILFFLSEFWSIFS